MDKISCEMKKLSVLWPDPSFFKKCVGYQTLEFYCGKTGQAFDLKFGMCVGEHVVCLVKSLILKLVKYFEMSLLKNRECKPFC